MSNQHMAWMWMTALVWYGLGVLGLVVLAGLGLAEKESVAALLSRVRRRGDRSADQGVTLAWDEQATVNAQYAASISAPMPRVMRARQF